jgi:hypothetical protein
MRKSKVSILLCSNLNRPRTVLFQSLKSISDQKLGDFNFELLLCIDGEPKSFESYEVLAYLENLNLSKKVFFSGGKWGLAKCLNYLIRNSDTELYIRHDDDDIMLRDRLFLTTQYFRQTKGPVLFGTNYYTMYDKGLSSTSSRIYSLNLTNAPSTNQLKSLPPISPPFAHPTISFSAVNLKNELSFYDERFIYAQDFKFYLDNLHLLQFISAPFESIIYRVQQTSIEKRRLQLHLHDLALYEFYMRYFSTSFADAQAFRCNYVSSEFCSMNTISQERAADFARGVLQSGVFFNNF